MSYTIKLQCCITADFHVRKVKVNTLGELKVLVSQWFATTVAEQEKGAQLKPEQLLFDYIDEDGDEVRVDSETEWKELCTSMNPVRVRVRRVGVDFGIPLPLPIAGSTASNFNFAQLTSSGNFIAPSTASSSTVSPSATNKQKEDEEEEQQKQKQQQQIIDEKNRVVNEACPTTTTTSSTTTTTTNLSTAPCRAEEPAPKQPEEAVPPKTEQQAQDEEEEKKKKEDEQQQQQQQQSTDVVGPPTPKQKEENNNDDNVDAGAADKKKKEHKKENTTNNSAVASSSTSTSINNNNSNNKRFLSASLRPAYREVLTLLSNLYKVNATESITNMSGGVFRGAIRIQANLGTGEVKFEINDNTLHEHVALRIQELLNMNDKGSAATIAGDFVRLYPQSSSGHYNYAVVLVRNEQFDMALAELQHAVYLGVDAAAARSDADLDALNKFMVFRTLGFADDEEQLKKLTPIMEMFPEMKVETAQKLIKKHKNDMDAAVDEYLNTPAATDNNRRPATNHAGALDRLFGRGHPNVDGIHRQQTGGGAQRETEMKHSTERSTKPGNPFW